MSRLQNRIESLKNLKQHLIDKDIETKLSIFSYIQLLDYHIKLLEEVDELADSISNNDKEKLALWMKKRIG